MSPDWHALRAHFPTLEERVYCATQSLGPCPRAMLDDLDAFRRSLIRRNHALEEWVGRMIEVTGLIEQLLGAPAGSVALRDSATAAQAAIAACLDPRGVRRRILTCTKIDFHSSRYLWAAQAQRGFEVVDLPATDDGLLDLDALRASLDERVAVVALPLVSPWTSALLPAREVTAAARAAGALTVIDAYQGVGVIPIDVDALGADVVVGGTHKWLCGGDMGLAFLYVRPEWAAEQAPAYPGWVGGASLTGFARDFTPAAGAARFQQGSPAMAPIYTARAGLRFVLEVGVEAMRERTLLLGVRLSQRAEAEGWKLRSPLASELRGAMVCLDLPRSPELAMELRADGFDVDARPDAGLRVGPFPCLEEGEIDRLGDALRDRLKVRARA